MSIPFLYVLALCIYLALGVVAIVGVTFIEIDDFKKDLTYGHVILYIIFLPHTIALLVISLLVLLYENIISKFSNKKVFK